MFTIIKVDGAVATIFLANNLNAGFRPSSR
jgi:hypothetical protein